MKQLNLLIIGYNRFDYFERLLDAIPFSNLGKVLISIDGPKDNLLDKNKVHKIQNLAMQIINNYKNVSANFHEFNLGCRLHVQRALNIFFEHNSHGAILEDDCIPNMSFFRFMENALEKHGANKEIITVSGTNLFSNFIDSCNNPIYSKYPHSWGWGTWRDRLLDYDPLLSMSNREYDENFLRNLFDENVAYFWLDKFSKVRNNSIDTWDYQLVHLALQKSLKNLVSPINLVSNIGFGFRSTHTKNFFSRFSNLKKSEITIPIKEDSIDTLNNMYDSLYERFVCGL